MMDEPSGRQTPHWETPLMRPTAHDVSASGPSSAPAASSQPATRMLVAEDLAPPRRRRRRPLLLFLLTCLSTFWAGATNWMPWLPFVYGGKRGTWEIVTRVVESGWAPGLEYMAAVMLILLVHEMGHFLQAVRYRIPATFPIFLPIPISITGTMGAVIGMEGSRADRRQLFDIGVSGPLAGLLVAVPVLWLGIVQADFTTVVSASEYSLGEPLICKLFVAYLRPELPAGAMLTLNPLLMAGWVGMLVTGLNMLPVSQLDGGHVLYGLFGRRAWTIARLFVVGAIGAMIIADDYQWTIMLVIVLLIGIDHPPSRDDSVQLGPGRQIVGWLSLLIPVFCFTPAIM